MVFFFFFLFFSSGSQRRGTALAVDADPLSHLHRPNRRRLPLWEPPTTLGLAANYAELARRGFLPAENHYHEQSVNCDMTRLEKSD
jgi:hypothetical protein